MENKKTYDHDGTTRHEYVGDCVAYMDTGDGLTNTLVEYKVKFSPTGELLQCCPPENRSEPINESHIVILISKITTTEDALYELSEASKMISRDGLYLGDWPTYDDNNPYELFDRGDRIIGKQDI